MSTEVQDTVQVSASIDPKGNALVVVSYTGVDKNLSIEEVLEASADDILEEVRIIRESKRDEVSE